VPELDRTTTTPIDEYNKVDNPDIPRLSSTNTRRAGTTPILSKRDSTQKVSSTKLLGI